jgi:N-methylhydantoinase A/oxoprolinase/acetone carboxylase beta subunit
VGVPVTGQAIRLAVDIGGTFTDLVAQDVATGHVVREGLDE